MLGLEEWLILCFWNQINSFQCGVVSSCYMTCNSSSSTGFYDTVTWSCLVLTGQAKGLKKANRFPVSACKIIMLFLLDNWLLAETLLIFVGASYPQTSKKKKCLQSTHIHVLVDRKCSVSSISLWVLHTQMALSSRLVEHLMLTVFDRFLYF